MTILNNTLNNTEDEEVVFEYLQSFESRLFWIIFFCLFSPITLFCFYYSFYHLFQQRQHLLYKNLNNHTLLCLLITDYLMVQIELPMTIAFLSRNRILIERQSFCVLWNYWFYVWSTQSIQFSMLIAINRYLLIFHKTLLLKYQFYCHYLPILCIWLYLPCIHLYFIVFFPYGNTTFNFSKVWCGGPQFLFVPFYVTWDTLFNTFIPMSLLILFNIIITTRVVFLKKVSTTAVSKWKKNRRMILQLFAICSSQLIGGLPYCIITLGVIFISPTFAVESYTQLFIYTFYIPSLCSPLFAIITLPKEKRDNLTVIIRCCKEKQNTSRTEKIPTTAVDPTTKHQVQLANIKQIASAIGE